MSTVNTKELRDTIAKYIADLRSASYVEVHVLKVKTDITTGNVVAEGTYETGIFSDTVPFRIEFDKNMNPLNIDLTGNSFQSKRS